MRRSKLEMYLDILRVLAQTGPLKLTHVMYKTNVNCSILKEYLNFLIQKNLVAERTVNNKRLVYVITDNGVQVLRSFRELKTLLPITEEDIASIPLALY